MLDPARPEHGVEVAGPVGRAVVRHDPLDLDPEGPVERQRPLHEGAGRRPPLVGEKLRVGHPAVVVDGHVEARGPSAAPRAAAAAEGPVPAAVRDPRHLLHVDVDELAGPLPLVAYARDGAAHARLAGHAVDVRQARQAPAGDDPRAGAGGHARLGRKPERREQQLRPGPGHLLLDLGRRVLMFTKKWSE